MFYSVSLYHKFNAINAICVPVNEISEISNDRSKRTKNQKKKKTYAISKIYAYLYVIIHLNMIIS